MTRKAALIAALLAVPALAQEEWTPVPVPPQTPGTVETPLVTPGPQEAAPSPTPPAATPPQTAVPTPSPATAAPSAQAPTPAPAPASAAPKAGEEKVTVTPGSEMHSPGTVGNRYDDKANLRVGPAVLGAAGLWRLHSADLGRAGVVRIAASGEFMALRNFPVLDANNTRQVGTFSLSWVPLQFLEAYLSYGASANLNTRSSPQLQQAQGDLAIGAVAAMRVVKGLHLGVDLRLSLYPGVGTLSPDRYAAGFAPRALATFDVREFLPAVPARAMLNFGFVLDGTSGLVTQHPLSPSEEFALGINKYHRMVLALGLEAPLPYVTPFVEWGFGLPLASETVGPCVGSYTGPDGNCVTAGQAMPHTLGAGLKVTALRDVTISLGMEFGLASRVARGIPATQPYNFVFGVSYNVDPLFRGESRLVERAVDKPVEVVKAATPTTGKVAGVVLDAETKKPVGGALVTMDGGQLPPVASEPTAGRFLSYELPPGKVTLSVAKEGYKPLAQEATIEVGKLASLEVALVREVRNASLTLKTTSEKKPVAATFDFAGPKPISAATDATGAGSVQLPAGHWNATVSAQGYLAKAREIDAVEGGQVMLDIELVPAPKKPLVKIVENKIRIRQQVHFAFNKATILADSYPLLDQVIDAVVRANLKKVRVEGHTDNVGGKERNKRLSEDRAKAVVEHLVKNGVEPKRLEAQGFGDQKPVAPNLTARGRELNRRVEFVILER